MASYDPLPAVNKAFGGFLSFARVIERLNASANLVRQPDGLSTSPFNEHLVSFLEPGGVSRWAHS